MTAKAAVAMSAARPSAADGGQRADLPGDPDREDHAGQRERGQDAHRRRGEQGQDLAGEGPDPAGGLDQRGRVLRCGVLGCGEP
jgi:hypothetical protein